GKHGSGNFKKRFRLGTGKHPACRRLRVWRSQSSAFEGLTGGLVDFGDDLFLDSVQKTSISFPEGSLPAALSGLEVEISIDQVGFKHPDGVPFAPILKKLGRKSLSSFPFVMSGVSAHSKCLGYEEEGSAIRGIHAAGAICRDLH